MGSCETASAEFSPPMLVWISLTPVAVNACVEEGRPWSTGAVASDGLDVSMGGALVALRRSGPDGATTVGGVVEVIEASDACAGGNPYEA